VFQLRAQVLSAMPDEEFFLMKIGDSKILFCQMVGENVTRTVTKSTP
jgi:hypothetical protein